MWAEHTYIKLWMRSIDNYLGVKKLKCIKVSKLIIIRHLFSKYNYM